MDATDELLLEHFGTKGMKWGVRKDPEKKQAGRDAKAKKFEDKAKEIQAQIDKTNPRRIRRINELREEQYSALDDARRKHEGKLSKRQKKVAIGASVVGAIVASRITYNAIQSGNARRLSAKGKDFVMRKKGLPWKLKPELRDPNLDVDGIMHNVVRPINPQYGATGTKQNCRRATYAYEMRRRGYDVAATRTNNGRGQDVTGAFNVLHPNINNVPVGRSGIMARVFGEIKKDQKPFTEFANQPGIAVGKQSFDGVDIGRRLKSAMETDLPDGARGELGAMWKGGGGHSMAWEKIKGEVVIFDNQTGKKYQGDDFLKLSENFGTAGFTRLDNLTLDNDFLRRWIKNA